MAFWDAEDTVLWFKQRGYTLYKRMDVNASYVVPSLPSAEVGLDEYPYSYYENDTSSPRIVPLRAYGEVALAQDSKNRHVAIKIVHQDSDEHRILEFLRNQDLETLKEHCVVPVLDILSIKGFCFVVMPRWGTTINAPAIQTAGELLFLMRSMLKGLAFLHEHNIFHRARYFFDIHTANFLVSHFTDSVAGADDSKMRAGLRSQNKLLYAISDFDFSMMLPPEVNRSKFRLPYYESWGTFNVTTDTAQGEFDFNPFVMDVGALGVLFCHSYQPYTREIPILAPFLDRMTTRDLAKRFTASEALDFFENMTSQLTEHELRLILPPISPFLEAIYYEYDRWANLPKEFVEKWAHYREPPIPLTTKILRSICDTDWGGRVLPLIRLFFSRAISSVRASARPRPYQNVPEQHASESKRY
ncbi:hypothetical protein CPC08DRAFT_687690 [Agrocybe pediades]|nr:hypothetical protein CPC08DRAFT_687690 [Agrocybe pediades]